jgi:LCP family protein required for cell wall assembly
MQSRPAPPEPRRSAFAAAFLSILIPGLGQAYLRRWGRALLWLAPWVIAIVLIAGFGLSIGLKNFATNFIAPSWLQGVLIGVAVDLVYRLACVLDAWWLARSFGYGNSPLAQVGSVAGLAAVLLVLVVSHVAVARPVFQASQYIQSFDSGDPTAVETLSPEQAASLGIRTLTPGPTLQPGETASPTPAPTPTPTTGPPWNGKDPLNILLIGADSGRAGYTGYLTDTMMTISVDPRTKQVAFISLPRDMTGVPLPPSWGATRVYGSTYGGKINSLYTDARSHPTLFPGTDKTRGYEALKGALSQLYGIPIRYYLAVDLQGFRDVIQTLGGVIVDVQAPVYDAHYPSNDSRGIVKLYIPPGFQRMNGKEALSYARARHATDDFDRSSRQQRVVTSVRDQTDLSSLLAPGVISSLLKDVRRSVRTDIPPDLLPAMVQLASEVNLDNRISLVLGPPSYGTECYLGSACPNSYQLIANVPAIRSAVQHVFSGDRKAELRKQRIGREEAVVQVLNGTRGTNTRSTNIADYLNQEGISATVPPVNGGHAGRSDYTRTVITAYNGAEGDKEETIARLKEIFKVDVQAVDDPSVKADIVVVVGTATPTLRAG